jgi:kinase suppressor of Ras 2
MLQSPIELSPPETQNSTSSLMTTGTLTSSSDKLLNMISPEENSGVSNLSPSPSPPQSPSVQSSSLGSNKKHATKQKYHHHNINNNILSFNGGNRDMASSISSNGTSSASYNLNNNDIEMEATNPDYDSMSKSKSNESQLSNGSQKQWQQNGITISSSDISSETTAPVPAPRTKYLSTVSSHLDNDNSENSIHHQQSESYGSSMIATPIISDTVPPRSPCTPVRAMGHMIQHRFSKKFKFPTSTCDLCNKQMIFGFKCTECKYRCHKSCKSNVPPSCGLPKEFVDEFKKSYLNPDGLMPNASPSLSRASGLMPAKRTEPRHRTPMHPNIPFHGPDSSSAGSSCNSSSPSSPALNTILPQTPANKSQFNFPEVSSASSSNMIPSNHQLSSHHNVNNSYTSYPNTIIEDAEFDLNQPSSYAQGHSRNGGTVFLRNNYHHSLTSPLIAEDGQIISEHNGSIIDSIGELVKFFF